VEGFGQRRMHENCAGNILKHRAHLDRGDKLAGEFGHIGADRAADAMMIALRNVSNESAFDR